MSDRSEVVQILSDIPEAFASLLHAVSAPKRVRSSGVKVAGGTRDYVPLNVDADAAAQKLKREVFRAHRKVSEFFGETPQPVSLSIACADLTRWCDIWTRADFADELIAGLKQQVSRAWKLCGRSEGPTQLPQTVCPACLSLGGMVLHEGNGEDERYACEKCGMSWEPSDYHQAVTDVLSRLSPAA
ncbi:MAG: hypothetical protein EKK42_20310 [Pseudonocardiaceae bacterium]|nr:MAG: hypothetical protein EKK42_20310 [Pseudonocardiaceae bacterium]